MAKKKARKKDPAIELERKTAKSVKKTVFPVKKVTIQHEARPCPNKECKGRVGNLTSVSMRSDYAWPVAIPVPAYPCDECGMLCSLNAMPILYRHCAIYLQRDGKAIAKNVDGNTVASLWTSAVKPKKSGKTRGPRIKAKR